MQKYFTKKITAEFVTLMPDELKDGILYISIKYRVAIHKCCCGCGEDVVTPLSPLRWEFTFNGETISLNPSIGRWSAECQSHYWITNGIVKPARKYTETEKEFVRKKNKRNIKQRKSNR